MEYTKEYAEKLAEADREIEELRRDQLKHHRHIKRSKDCRGCASFPFALCVACAIENGSG